MPHKRKLQALATGALLFAALYTLGTGTARAPAAPACPAPVEPGAAASRPVLLDAGQHALADSIARRFQVAREAVAAIVATAYRAAERTGLDPLLVLAVISVESRFNPLAESTMGAKGLMQIIPRFHRAKLAEHGGDEAILDPERNVEVGARILQEYVHRFGTLEAGLQYYNGAMRDSSAQYARKVMAERQRLLGVLRRAFAQSRASADPA